MTKIKNTKKGMAKKTLSVSLAVAMLATSNVPVWAAEDLFTDSAVFTSEVEAPVMEEVDVPVAALASDEPVSTADPSVEPTPTTTPGTIIWKVGNKAVDGTVNVGETITISTDFAPDRAKNITKVYLNLWADGIEDQGTSLAKSFSTTNGQAPADITYKVPIDEIGHKLFVTVSYLEGENWKTDYASTGIKNQEATVGFTPKADWGSLGENGTLTGNTPTYTFKKGDKYEPVLKTVTIGDEIFDSTKFSYSYENNTSGSTLSDAKVVVVFNTTAGALSRKTIKIPFTINPADLSKATVTLSGSYVYAPTPALQAESMKAAGLTVTLDGVTLKATANTDTSSDEYKAADVLVSDFKADEAGSNKGSLTITAKNGDYKNTKTFTFDVAKKDLSTAFVINPEDENYTGTYITPGMAGNAEGTASGVYYKKNPNAVNTGISNLAQGVDFEIDWNGTNFNKGTATATITGKGNYTGTTTATFQIKEAAKTDFDELIKKIDSDLLNNKATKNNGVYEFTYTGKEQDFILPAYGLSWTLGSEYTYSYQGQHTNVGDFNITIYGQNSYANNSETLKCRIVPKSVNTADFTQKTKANPNGNIVVTDLEYNLDATNDNKNTVYKPTVSITWKGMTLQEDIDYKIENVNANLTTRTVTFDIKGLGNYKDVKTGLTATILGKDINSSSITIDAIANQEYTGTAISMKGKLVVKDGDKTLTENTDYHVVIERNNTKPGVATVTIAGQGNYSGERDVTFLIVNKAYNATIVNRDKGLELPSKKYTYNAANSTKGIVLDAAEFQVIDKDGKTVNADYYDVTYENNRSVGTATIKVTGKDGYDISAISTFVIKPQTLVLSGDNLAWKTTPAVVYTGEEIKPEYKVTLTDGAYTLVEGTDYKVEYSNNVNAYTTTPLPTDQTKLATVPNVTITGLGNYAGLNENDKLPSFAIGFNISKATITNSEVTANNVGYAGGLDVSDITVKNPVSGKVLEAGTDYTVELKNAKEVGVAEATIKLTDAAKKNYKFGSGDSLVVRYNVTKKNLAECDVTVDKAKDGAFTTTVMNGTVKETTEKFEVKDNGDGTATVSVVDGGKNYTGSKTVDITTDGKKFPVGTPVLKDVVVAGNKATAVLDGTAEDAEGYDFVVATADDYVTGRVAINKNRIETEADFYYLAPGTYYAYCHAWKRDEDGRKVFGDWSKRFEFTVTAVTPETPVITGVKVSGSTVTVTYTECEDAEGYDVVLGTTTGKAVSGEKRPYEYGTLVKKVKSGTTVTATFKNVEAGTYYAGLHAWNRTSEDGKKVFSKWSNVKTVKVK